MRGAAAGLILILASPAMAQSIDDDLDIDRQGSRSMEECLRDPDDCDLANTEGGAPAAAPSPESATGQYYEEPAPEPELYCPEGEAACDDGDG